MVLEQGVHSGADHQGRKDDAFLDIQFTITERCPPHRLAQTRFSQPGHCGHLELDDALIWE